MRLRPRNGIENWKDLKQARTASIRYFVVKNVRHCAYKDKNASITSLWVFKPLYTPFLK
jgi:hypothetical protein